MFHDIFMAVLYLCLGIAAVWSFIGLGIAFFYVKNFARYMWDAFKVPKAG